MKKLGIQIPNNKNVKVDIKYFFCELTPLTRDKVLFKAIVNVDPKVNFIPAWVLNFFIKKIGGYMLGKLIKLARNIKGTEWET